MSAAAPASLLEKKSITCWTSWPLPLFVACPDADLVEGPWEGADGRCGSMAANPCSV